MSALYAVLLIFQFPIQLCFSSVSVSDSRLSRSGDMIVGVEILKMGNVTLTTPF